MSAACDLFSGLAERQMLIEGRTTCLRTGGAGPPIGKDPVGYVDHTLSSWAKSRDLSPFSPAALGHYRRPLAALERLHAVCRIIAPAPVSSGGWTKPEADIGAGRRIARPTFVLWASHYLTSNSLASWQAWCVNSEGAAVDGRHFLAEEIPPATLAVLIPYLQSLAPRT
jgi:haloacetate dehalogenase